LKPRNPSQYVAVDAAYLAGLPKGDTRGPAPSTFEAWVAMDYGPNLTATYEIGADGSNFAYKGIAVRLDAGPGGVTQGRYWMLYDEDTPRVAGAWSGEQFIDYNAIMLNGKHAVHPRIVGRLHFENKTGPGWGNPGDGGFDAPRFLGRDDRPYGPLPRDWAHYKGLYHHGSRVIVSYTVGRTSVLEMPAVSCWDGDVWLVSGIDSPQDGLTWQRIASRMFQPLGVKVVGGKIHVTCRDQIAILHDLNGDGETDFYENFNNDHQVTDHFHEFAMGLQCDAEGNFYYCKACGTICRPWCRIMVRSCE